MNSSPPQIKTAVVIATKDRFELLAGRAIASVIEQTRCPNFVVVVDDSTTELRCHNAAFIQSLQIPGCKTIYLENQRSEGASGSWNTAIDLLLEQTDDPQNLYVAFLDDDDAWSSTYLDSCLDTVSRHKLDMVAAGINRFETVDGKAIVNQSPEKLLAEDFLVGNPGIQGSNLFLRLSVLLAAGCFDEDLKSCTDRDLCIRLADLGVVRYERFPSPLVNHFADSGRARLSTRGSEVKLRGLTSFWNKYASRMNAEQKAAFCTRATTLFDWCPPPNFNFRSPCITSAIDKSALVLAFLVDSNSSAEYFNAIQQAACFDGEGLVGLDIVLLERNTSSEDTALVDLAASKTRDAGAGCFRIPTGSSKEVRNPERQLDQGTFDSLFASQPRRDVLQLCGIQVAKRRPGSEVWLVEDLKHGDRNPHLDSIQSLLSWLGAIQVDITQLPLSESLQALEQLATIEQWIHRQRIVTARHRIIGRFSLETIRELGSGSEAVVFTDGHTVYKCIDYWKTRMPEHQLDFLREQVGRWEGIPGLYPIKSIEQDGPWIVLTYEYEESVPYEGGYESDLLKLLDGCTAAGIVCNNIHPKNLVITATGVKLIDYGSDIRRWSPLGFEHMALRAFISCRYPTHPELKQLMRRVLNGHNLPELDGYWRFRTLLSEQPHHICSLPSDLEIESKAPEHEPFSLYIGVITSDPPVLSPLLRSLGLLQKNPSIKRLLTIILDNGSPSLELAEVVQRARRDDLDIAVVNLEQQVKDAEHGAFGQAFSTRLAGQVGIAQARTMLQRYLGTLMERDKSSFAWILDDDMRVDDRANSYLPWLPAFRKQGVDVLIGAYEGSSPNPPLNGLRGQLVDLHHNLLWLQNLPDESVLPNRSDENAIQRERYPDYYYDLSRKHSGHLEMPHWLEPAHQNETVAEARSRLIAGAIGILKGAPLTRPIVSSLPSDPLKAAQNSVNRGGCTFVITPAALSRTPNMITQVQGREARRSDMIWAIVNRYYRHMTTRAVGFPIRHIGRINGTPDINTEKVQGEIIGSALYAGITEFLNNRPTHDLTFSTQEVHEVQSLTIAHMSRRLLLLEQSFYRIIGLVRAIRSAAPVGVLDELLHYLEHWFNIEEFRRIQTDVVEALNTATFDFLTSLQTSADEYASQSVDISFIVSQLGLARTSNKRS